MAPGWDASDISPPCFWVTMLCEMLRPRPGALTGSLRSDERVEDALGNVGRNSGPVVGHFDDHMFPLRLVEILTAPCPSIASTRVVQDVGPDLVELSAEPIYLGHIVGIRRVSLPRRSSVGSGA